MQLSESSQPVWVELKPTFDQTIDTEEEQRSAFLIKSGVVSNDGVWVHEFFLEIISKFFYERTWASLLS